MDKEKIEIVLKEMAIELAKKYNYNKAHEDKRKSKHKIRMHFFSSDTDENYYFVQYGTTDMTNRKKNGGMVEFRYRFSNSRLDVYLPDRKGFASLEFSNYKSDDEDDWYYSESQIFYEEGIKLFHEIYDIFFMKYKELLEKENETHL